jgi:hypothetical protein
MSILRLKEQKAKEGPQQQTSPYATDDGAEFLEREFKKNPKPTTQDLRQFAEDMGVELARINVCLHNLQVSMPALITSRTGSKIDVSMRSKKRSRKPNFEIDAEAPKEKRSLRMWRRLIGRVLLALETFKTFPRADATPSRPGVHFEDQVQV